MASILPCLKTERLSLCNISLSDTEKIVDWRSDPDVYCFFLSPHPIKAQDHVNWFNNIYLLDDNRCDWMALDKNNESVGVFGIKRISEESSVAEISYILAPNKRGYGYAKEAILKLITYAISVWHTKEFIAEIHVDNLASIHFAKNLGMKFSGLDGNFCTFSMNADNTLSHIVYIRCDGNQNIGTGHVMRCLAIADQIKKIGNMPIFLVADDSVSGLISEKKHKTICLNSSWNKLEAEVDFLEKMLSGREKDNLLVDSYYATPEYLKKLSSFAEVTYIDDLCEDKYDVKNLVNYNYYASDMGYEKLYEGENTLLYLGPYYTPLRAEFKNLCVRAFHGINRVLITTGGTDNYNVLDYLLEYFVDRGINVDIFAIVGRFNKNKDQLYKKYATYNNIHMLININNMHEYMLDCDFCITAGGTTLYELCACGTPSLMYVLADNQLDAAKKFNDTNLIPCIGDVRTELGLFAERIDKQMERYSNEEYWESISKSMTSIVDANGASRIAKLL